MIEFGAEVQTFQVEQAVFASSDRGSMKGYQLVGRSKGVDRATAQSLCRWAPTQVPSNDPAKWMINYFPVSDELVAVTRTVLGGPEYSSRGGTDVVTVILLLNDEQFHAYACNPVWVAKTALAIGELRLPLDNERDPLPSVALPTQPLVASKDVPILLLEEDDPSEELQILNDVAALIRHARRVALIGHADPISAAEMLIPKLSLEDRRNFSFTTGLNPTVRRPFQAHFLPSADLARQRTLDAQEITRVDWSLA